MFFDLLKARRDETEDTGTYADGVFDIPAIDIKTVPRRVRGHVAHRRDYAVDRPVADLPVGLA